MVDIPQLEANTRPSRFKNFLWDLFDLFVFTLFVGGLVLFIRFFVVNPFIVVGQSMEPTFHQNDFIVIDKVTPKIKDNISRGDVIVFVPKGEQYPFIKRVIGLPGENVLISGWKVYICQTQEFASCEELPEPYLGSWVETKIQCIGTREQNKYYSLESGYFVMGDNRSHSADSRCCFGLGCYSGSSWEVTKDEILGKVYLRILPHFDTKF